MLARHVMSLFFASIVLPSTVLAQAQTSKPPAISAGDAVVSGFSGTLAPGGNPAALPPPVERQFINPEAPSVRVLDIARPGRIWEGQAIPTLVKFEAFARETGQVFGIAVTDQPNPDIFLAATSAYGLHLAGRNSRSEPERRKKGGPGVGWMRGQFGLDLQGGPGSVYKIDGRTGAVSLFANITLENVPNHGPGLGNIAYDAANKQLFVTDLATGMIHRLAADGRELDIYDHGVNARPAAQLPPAPFDPRTRASISREQFDSENPATWGFAPPARRVFAVTLHQGRLYYSVAEKSQIWSVGIAQNGAFANDPRWELDVAGAAADINVTDIAFSEKGAMILAERPASSGSFAYTSLVKAGEPRVLRYWPKQPNDPAPGLWTPQAEEYAIGFAGQFRNTNGGVALGYGYDRNGNLAANSCQASLWTTAQNIRNAPALRDRLQPGGPLAISGLYGAPSAPARPFNEPPFTSYSVDYNGQPDQASTAGHMGSVRIFTTPCLPNVANFAGPGFGGTPPYISGPVTIGGGGGGSGECIGPNCSPCQFGVNPDGSCVPPPIPIDLTIKKTAGEVKFDPKTLTWTTTFTLNVTNNGAPFTPGNAISINDPIPAGLTLVSATGTGWTCTGAVNCGYNFGPGIFNTGATLPPIVITVTSKTPGKYDNCATVGVPPGSGLAETSLANNRDCASVEFKYPPNDISVVKVPQEGNCSPLSTCTFAITVTNNSPWPFNGPVTVSDNAGTPMTIGSTNLPCSPAPSAIPFSCVANISLPAGVSSQTFTIVGIIPAGGVPAGTTQTNTNCITVGPAPSNPGFPSTVTSETKDCKNYNACGFQCHMTQDQIDKIKIEKKANSPTCSPGGLCSFTFTITNTSATNATGVMPISFIDTMPPGSATFVPPPTPFPWSCIPFAGNLKCLYPPSSIPAGGSISVVLTYQIAPGYSQPTLTNCGEFFTGATASTIAARQMAGSMAMKDLETYLVQRGLSKPGEPVNASVLKSVPVKPGPDDKSCATVNITQPPSGETGSIIVKKEVVPPAGVAMPDMTFPVTVACGSQITNLNLGSNGEPQTVSNIPAGTSCTVSEGAFTSPPGLCQPPAGTAYWTTALVPSGSVVAATPPPVVNVRNTFTCGDIKPAGQITVTKVVVSSNPNVPAPVMTFPINVTCSGGPVVNLAAGASQTLNGAIGTSCNIFEPPPSTVGSSCPANQTPGWTTSYSPSTSVTFANPPSVVTVTNTFHCSPTKEKPPVLPIVTPPRGDPQSCAPPKIPGPVRGQCVCPQGTSPRGASCLTTELPKACPPTYIKTRSGECVCPRGTEDAGGRCIRPRPVLSCQPPAFANRAGTACLCPANTLRRGNTCIAREVRPRIVCQPPARLNPRGNACIMPRDPRDPRMGPGRGFPQIQIFPGFGGPRDGGPRRPGGEGVGRPGAGRP